MDDKWGDKLVQAVNRRNQLHYLWRLFCLPELAYDSVGWQDWLKGNMN